MIGIIFHWGLSSVPAFFPVREKHGLNNGSEWYLRRLQEKGTYRPISKWKETQQYHKDNYGDRSYENFADDFSAEKWNPDDWMKLCKSIGATYVILTSRHHDGFCLWNTKTTNYNSVETECGKNIVEMFANSARKYGLKFGLYYSWLEFDKSFTKKYFTNIVQPQIEELLKYNPDMWFFDGDWVCNTNIACKFISDTIHKIKEKNPKVEINDRLGVGKLTGLINSTNDKNLKEQRKDPNFLGDATYRTYGDRELPETTPKVPWEHINTIGYSWGRNKQQTEKHYKSGKELKKLYDKVRNLNGNFLLNLGPNSDGTLDEFEVKSLREFSNKLKTEDTK